MLEQILQALQAGTSLSEEQKDYMTKALKGAASGKVSAGMTAEEQAALLKSADDYKNSPGMQEYARDMISEKRGDRFVRRYKPMFNAILSGAGVAASLSQINKSNQILRGLTKPGIPAPTGIDPALNAEIYKAQRGSFDASRAIAPAVQGINDQYNKDVNTAGQLSNGQSGAYGSMVQSASNAAKREYGKLPAMSDAIRREQQQIAAGLVSTRQNATVAQDSQRLQGAALAQNQYSQDATAAGALGSQGRTNLFNTLQTLPDNLLGAAGRLITPNDPSAGQAAASEHPYDKYYNSLIGSLSARAKQIGANARTSNASFRRGGPAGFYKFNGLTPPQSDLYSQPQINGLFQKGELPN